MDRESALAELTGAGELYELENVELYDQTCRAFKNAPATLRALYDQSRSDLPFIVYEDETISFEQAWGEAARVARLLADEYGIGHGDRVAISMRNYPEWIIAFKAVTSLGAIAVAMNSLWQPDEMTYGLRDSGAKVLFADAERLERLSRCADPLGDLSILAVRTDALYDLPNSRCLVDALAGQPACEMPDATIHPNDDATIFYTSGSTGHPKGVVSCHRNLISALLSWELDALANARMNGKTLPPSPGQEAVLLAVPLFHATGSHAVYLLSYRSQRRIVSMYKWDVEHAGELIERERVSSVVAPAAMTGDLLELARRGERDLSSLTFVGGGGAPRAPSQVQGIHDHFEGRRRARAGE